VADEFEICNHPGPANNDEPCCREKGHEDEHWFWYQVGGSIHVFTAEGERVMHLSVTGHLNQDEVAILVAYMEFARNMMAHE